MIDRGQFIGSGRKLEAGDIARVALEIEVEEAAIHAVIEVESGGGWFTDVRRELLSGTSSAGFTGYYPAILFEAHRFSAATGGRYDQSHPQLSSPTWNRELYRGGLGEYDRLLAAIALDRRAALESASWGMFQILGSNHAMCGFADVEAFVRAQCAGEAEQLQSFVAYIRSAGLDYALRRRDWKTFARKYNGARYAENQYDTRLERAYRKHLPDGIGALQAALNRHGAKLTVDGKLGQRTRDAIVAFQRAAGLKVDGIAGPKTREALGLVEPPAPTATPITPPETPPMTASPANDVRSIAETLNDVTLGAAVVAQTTLPPMTATKVLAGVSAYSAKSLQNTQLMRILRGELAAPTWWGGWVYAGVDMALEIGVLAAAIYFVPNTPRATP